MKNKKEILEAIGHVLTEYKNGNFHDKELGSKIIGKNWIEVTQKQSEILDSFEGSTYSVSITLNENYKNEECKRSGILALPKLQVRFKEEEKPHYYVSMLDGEFYPWAELYKTIEMLCFFESPHEIPDEHFIATW